MSSRPTKCSAGTKRRGDTCFTKQQLALMCEQLEVPCGSADTKRVLWAKLNEAFSRKFGCADADEGCWGESSGTGLAALAPRCPQSWKKDASTWLTNIDIMKVMKPYERRYPSFMFAGVFPIDFAARPQGGACVSEIMCNLDMRKIAKRYGRLGFVFNLDEHDEPGSHWVAMYVGLRKGKPNYGAFYYDSNGDSDPPLEIRRLQRRVADQMDDKAFRTAFNTTRHQYENSECGMFCVHFLTECLRNRPFDTIMRTTLRDKAMNKLRFESFSC